MKAITLRMPNKYGVVYDYRCKNECPYCKSKITNVKAVAGCYDGEHTYVDSFTCETNCDIPYEDMISYNKLNQ